MVQRTIASSKNGKYKVAENQPLLTALERVFAKYDEVYTKQTFSRKGKSVAEADEARDKALVSIKNFLWGVPAGKFCSTFGQSKGVV